MNHPIAVPKELVNDEAYLVARLLATPGERVAKGQPLAELETSKASFSLASPADGFFHPDFAESQMVPVHAVFGMIADDEATLFKPPPSSVEAERIDARFSRAAWELFRSSGLDIEQFAGMAHVRRADVEKTLTPAGGGLDASALVLLGGGGHCRECVEAIELSGKYRINGVIDTYAKPGTLVAGYPVLGDNLYLEILRKHGILHLVLAYGIAGGQAERGAHFRALSALGHNFPAIIHPKSSVHTQAVLGAGVHIMPGAVVGSEAIVGDACIINSNAVVSHDCRLASNVHIAPGAILAGGVTVGENSVVGMGGTVFMRTKIGENVVIYNGANVFADVPDNTIVKSNWPES